MIKAPPKYFGCASRLWTGGKKFCWTRCDNASTHTLWDTWCFTTNSTILNEQADYMECDSDEICGSDWKCLSSCGIFSPHWDRGASNLDETV